MRKWYHDSSAGKEIKQITLVLQLKGWQLCGSGLLCGNGGGRGNDKGNGRGSGSVPWQQCYTIEPWVVYVNVV